MKHKLFVVTMVALMLAAAAPVLAAGPGGGQGGGDQNRHQRVRQPFALVGTITALGTDTITVEVSSGNRHVKPYIGQELAIRVTGSTRYMRRTSTGSVPVAFTDLSVGDPTSMNGLLSEGTFTATRVTIDIPRSGTER